MKVWYNNNNEKKLPFDSFLKGPSEVELKLSGNEQLYQRSGFLYFRDLQELLRRQTLSTEIPLVRQIVTKCILRSVSLLVAVTVIKCQKV